MMDYEIKQLSPELVYIKWNCTPAKGAPSELQYLDDVKKLLEEAQKPLYFVSDLRKGRIINFDILRKLGQLLNHPNYAGSTAFSQNPITAIMVGVFTRFAKKRTKPQDEIWETPEDALAYLETLKPGITQDIDWNAALGITQANS